MEKQVRENLVNWRRPARKLGDAKDPLLVSVRSGAARSMPGMMETVLNLGLNDQSVEALARTKNARSRGTQLPTAIQMYSTVVVGLSKETLEDRLHALKHRVTASRTTPT